MYDGDVISIRGIYSDEANAEAEDMMNKKTSALTISGVNSKTVSKELLNSMFELTKLPSNLPQKHVSSSDQESYLSMSYSDITRSFLVQTFADTVDCSKENVSGGSKSRYNTWDAIDIPKDYFYPSQPPIHSTIGRFIVNKFILEGCGAISLTGYVDKVLNKGTVGDLDDSIGRLYLKDKINRAQFDNYTDRRDTLGYWVNGFLAHTISERMLSPLPEVEKKKAELIKKYQKQIDAGDLDVMTQITDELVAYAKDILKNDPGMDLYDSGDLSFGNNYKNNSIIKGAVPNELTGEYDFIETSFMDGIEKKDIPAHANSILASQYPASIATADAGYMSKKLLALMQMMEVDPDENSDCGTKQLIPITITKKNKKQMLYTYIKAGEQLILLDEDNIDSYVGKRVMMRSPMTCTHQKICAKCAGKLFYMMGITNAGLYSVQISHASLNLGLKMKHAANVALTVMDPDNIIKDI